MSPTPQKKKGVFMKLSVLERLLILNIDTLPQAGNIITMKIKKDIIDAVSFSEDEIKSHNLRQETDGRILWDGEIDDKEIEIGEQGLNLIIGALEKSERLTDKFVPFYDRLIAERDKNGITE